MSFYKIVEIAKEKQNITSDNQIAIKLGVSRSLVSGWKTGYSMPDGINTLKLINMAELSSNEAMEIIKEEIKAQKPLKQAGYAQIEFIAGISALSLLAVTGTAQTIGIASFSTALLCVLCKIA